MLFSDSEIESMVNAIERNFPEFLRAADLVKCGLYKSRSDISWSIRRGQAPPSIRLSSHKIVFPRANLCQWLKEKANICLIEEVASDAKPSK